MSLFAIFIALAILQIVAGEDVNTNRKIENSIRYDSDQLRDVLSHLERIERNNRDAQDRLERIERGNGHSQDRLGRMETKMETLLEQQHKDSIKCSAQHQNIIKPTAPTKPSYCDEALGESGLSGKYMIHNVKELKNESSFYVYCLRNIVDNEEEKPLNGNWLVIQRRQDGSEDFYRNWHDYKVGFGNINREFFLGMDKIHALTKEPQELWIKMTDNLNITKWRLYNNFSVDSESNRYTLSSVGDLVSTKGTAAESLRYAKGFPWSTKDRDTLHCPSKYYRHCAQDHNGAGWYGCCHGSNLNGRYGKVEKELTRIYWRPSDTLEYVHMAIRPRQIG